MRASSRLLGGFIEVVPVGRLHEGSEQAAADADDAGFIETCQAHQPTPLMADCGCSLGVIGGDIVPGMEPELISSYVLGIQDEDTAQTIHFIELKCARKDAQKRMEELIDAFYGVTGRPVSIEVLHEV
ncbi:hypothetical protein ACFWNE_06795 [Streptomyces goshikiensis]|uniref:hypothetical protein n=1 Tax=Streptomyces TaxID=1883 RepID=UPI000F3A829E|nr:hypothetical protein [Streptomyces sp. ADI95-16]